MTDEDVEVEAPRNRKVTCFEAECVNYGLVIEGFFVSTVICGGCGNIINSVGETDG